MSYFYVTTTNVIKTCLRGENALDALRHLWDTEIMQKLILLDQNSSCKDDIKNIFSKEEIALLDIEELANEISDYYFEDGDYPEFPENGASIREDGTCRVIFSCQGDGCMHEQLTMYFSFAIHSRFGTDQSFSQFTVCDQSFGKQDVYTFEVFADGHCEEKMCTLQSR